MATTTGASKVVAYEVAVYAAIVIEAAVSGATAFAITTALAPVFEAIVCGVTMAACEVSCHAVKVYALAVCEVAEAIFHAATAWETTVCAATAFAAVVVC